MNKTRMLEKDTARMALSLALIAVLGFGVYVNSLEGDFIWDDELLIKNNIYIKSWSHLPKIFTGDWGAGAQTKYTFYRPLPLLTYLINHSFSGLNVKCYHITNIMLHIAAALGLYWFVTLLSDDRKLAFLAGLFFAVHPIHTEAVSYISGRADSIAVCFLLFSFIFYIKYLRQKNTLFYTLVLSNYILALLSKENAVVFPALLFLYHYAFKEKIKPGIFLSVVGVFSLYAISRLAVLKSVPFTAIAFDAVLQRLPGFFVAITGYLRLLVLPINLHMEYGNRLFAFGDTKTVFGIFASFLLLAYSFGKRNKNNIFFFSVFWFFITLLPVSNLYPLPFYIAEHYLYLPSIGFFIILAKCLSSLYGKQKLKIYAGGAMAFLALFYSFLTIRQNRYWREPIAFYERTLGFAPESWRAHYNLAVAESAKDKKENAISSYKRAILYNPNFMPAYNNLALLYVETKEKEKATRVVKHAIEKRPDFVPLYNTLARTYEDDEKEEAIHIYEHAIRINPKHVKTYDNLGNLYFKMKRNEDAILLYQKAIEINPEYKEAHYHLGNLYSALGKSSKAIEQYKKAVAIDPNYTPALVNLGAEYMVIGKKDKAILALTKALEINPFEPDAHNNLAVLYYYSGRRGLALRHCTKALELGGEVHPDFLKLLKSAK